MACPNAIEVNSLYRLSTVAIVNYFKYYEKDLRTLPENILFDLYFKLYEDKKICLLGWELLDINVFARLLKVTHKRTRLLQCFQTLMDHGTNIAQELAKAYVEKCNSAQMCPSLLDSTIDMGLRLGGFLSDAGWFVSSENVLANCRDLCISAEKTAASLRRTLECCHKLIHVQAAYCQFGEAAKTFHQANELIKVLSDMKETPNLAGIYTEFSILFFVRSEYDEAYRWSVEAVKQLVPGLPPSLLIDVLRQVAKTCVVKRQFKKANVLTRQAVRMASEVYEPNHFKIGDALQNLGFFLVNSDNIKDGVKVYAKALKIKQATFKRKNIHVALALEDLSYALYVFEYSTGKFNKAREYSEEAIAIMHELLPPHHLMLASALRVKALILEEIALDTQGNSLTENLLPHAEKLHISALKMSIEALGDHSVIASKHYGNLGRLYQSMNKYKEAEEMHLKAISIKEQLLGKDDYEVALSIGHLASLYNYQTRQFVKAEKLYLRSIEMNLKLFGECYSGLEYDYRGLLHVYSELNDLQKVVHYTYVLNNWKVLRERLSMMEDDHVNDEKGPLHPLPELINFFFEK